MTRPEDGVEALAAHLKDCLRLHAAVVCQGHSSNHTVLDLIRQGWVLTGEDHAVGKRIRILRVPPVHCRWCRQVIRHHEPTGLLCAAGDVTTGACPANPLTGNEPHVGRHMPAEEKP